MKPAGQTSSRWRKLAVNLCLSAGTFLVCVLLFELILRLFGFGTLEIYEPDPTLYWRLKPNQDCYTKIGRYPVHINSHGTRGSEFDTVKPTNTFRLLCLGDSRTFGWGVPAAETYPARLQRLLQERVPSRRIEVINAGVNAWSYQQMLVYFRDTAIHYSPDVVILGEANLWTQFSENNSPEFVRKFMSRVRLKNLLRRSAIYHYVIEVKLKNFYERHRTRFIPVDPHQDTLFKEQQAKDPNAAFRAAIDQLCAISQSNRITPMLLFLPTEDETTGTNTPTILGLKRDIAQARGITLIDVTPAIRTSTGNGLYLQADPVHFNSQGHAVIARELLTPVLIAAQR